jgi:hypothetical protein
MTGMVARCACPGRSLGKSVEAARCRGAPADFRRDGFFPLLSLLKLEEALYDPGDPCLRFSSGCLITRTPSVSIREKNNFSVMK